MTLAHSVSPGGVPLELLLLAGALAVLGVVFFVQGSARPFVSFVLVALGIAMGTGSLALSNGDADAAHDHSVVSADSPDGDRRVPAVEVAQEEIPAEAEPGVWDLPMGDFAVALVIAALIGAVGGFVYAGIMGPRRLEETAPGEGESEERE